MWSIGVLLFEMTHRSTEEVVETGKLASNVMLGKEIKFKSTLTPECVSLLRALLTAKQSERPTIKEIFSHPWMVKHAKTSKIQFAEFLDQNKGFISMDESLSIVRSRYRGSTYLQESQADIKVANRAVRGRMSEGAFNKANGSTTRESMTPLGVKVSPHA